MVTPFTPAEDRRLRQMWCAMAPAEKIVAALAPRSAGEVLARIGELLDPPLREFDSEGIWRGLDLAVLTLAGRARPRAAVVRDGLPWLLDGRPAGAGMVVVAANIVRRHLGLAPIAWPCPTRPVQGGR